MSDSLYREQILEHWRAPRNHGALEGATHHAFLSNPLCGDEIDIALKVVDNRIADTKFTGRGCAISIAATSMLTEELQGKTIQDIEQMTSDHVIAMLGVTPNPARLKCALLGLQTVQKALH